MVRGGWSLSWTLIAAPLLTANAEAGPPLDDGAGANEIRVAWIDVMGAVPFGFEGSVNEVSRILKAVGLASRFRKADPGSVSGPDEIRIILLVRSPRTVTPGRLVMGAVRGGRAHEEAPAVWVYVEPVVHAIELRSVADDPEAVTRAIGRVIAHEVIHLLVPRLGHSKRGLMAGVLTPRDLLGTKVDIAPSFRSALRVALATEAAVAAAPFLRGAAVSPWRRAVWGSPTGIPDPSPRR